MRLPYGAVERAFFVRENVFVNVASRGIRKTRKCCSLCPPRRQQIRQHWHCCSLCCSFCPPRRQQILNWAFLRLAAQNLTGCSSVLSHKILNWAFLRLAAQNLTGCSSVLSHKILNWTSVAEQPGQPTIPENCLNVEALYFLRSPTIFFDKIVGKWRK